MLFAVIGIVIFLFGYNAYKKSKAAENWPTVQGRVISSEVDSYWSRSGSGPSKRMHRPKIVFQYAVDGQSHESTKVSFGSYSSSSSSNARKVVRKYPAQKQVTVYYDPGDPNTAILEPGVLGGIMIPFIAGPMFVYVGLVGALARPKQT